MTGFSTIPLSLEPFYILSLSEIVSDVTKPLRYHSVAINKKPMHSF